MVEIACENDIKGACCTICALHLLSKHRRLHIHAIFVLIHTLSGVSSGFLVECSVSEVEFFEKFHPVGLGILLLVEIYCVYQKRDQIIVTKMKQKVVLIFIF